MKFEKPNRAHSQALATSGIDAANYAERAKAYAAARGSGFVIRAIEGTNGECNSRQQATEPQWAAWVAYFDLKGIPRKFSVSHGLATVPCEWPEDFDLEWTTSNRGARLPRRVVPFDPDRVATANSIRRATEHMAMKPNRRREDWNMSAKDAEDFLREAGSRPVAPLSPEARARFGITPPAEAAE